MTSASDRREIIALLDEAMAAGARQASACVELALDRRTVQRWRASDGGVHIGRARHQLRSLFVSWARYLCFHRGGGTWMAKNVTGATFSVVLAVSLLCGLASWHVVERPALSLKRRDAGRRNSRTPVPEQLDKGAS